MIFKSVHFPNEIVATRRGSPLLIGVKTPKKLKVDFVDVEFGGIAEDRKLLWPFSPYPYESDTFPQSVSYIPACKPCIPAQQSLVRLKVVPLLSMPLRSPSCVAVSLAPS